MKRQIVEAISTIPSWKVELSSNFFPKEETISVSSKGKLICLVRIMRVDEVKHYWTKDDCNLHFMGFIDRTDYTKVSPKSPETPVFMITYEELNEEHHYIGEIEPRNLVINKEKHPVNPELLVRKITELC